MPYKKKYATEEERRKARSEAGKRGAAVAKLSGKKLGRPVGSRDKTARAKNPSASIPPKTMTVRENDYKVYVKLAHVENVPIVEFMHIVAESLKAKNPSIFSEEQKVQM